MERYYAFSQDNGVWTACGITVDHATRAAAERFALAESQRTEQIYKIVYNVPEGMRAVSFFQHGVQYIPAGDAAVAIAKATRLQAENEHLTAERDAARAWSALWKRLARRFAERWSDDIDADSVGQAIRDVNVCRLRDSLAVLTAERDALHNELMQSREDVEGCNRAYMDQQYRTRQCEDEIARITAERDALAEEVLGLTGANARADWAQQAIHAAIAGDVYLGGGLAPLSAPADEAEARDYPAVGGDS